MSTSNSPVLRMIDQATDYPVARLSDIFARLNMSELPALSQNVQELIAMTDRPNASNSDLSRLILQDYSLAGKVLQVANSAYYSQGRSCGTVSKAVATLGFNAIRNLAVGIGLFEDFFNSGVDTDAALSIVTRSFLAGYLARRLGARTIPKGDAEEVFLCSLFYHLGKVVLCLYLPVSYRDIEAKIETGVAEVLACQEVLAGLTLREVGIEVARFWNFPEELIRVMEIGKETGLGGSQEAGPDASLAGLIHFANTFVDSLCDGSDLQSLFKRHGAMLSLGPAEVCDSMGRCVDEAEKATRFLRAGVAKLKLRTRLRHLEVNARRGVLNSDTPGEQEKLPNRAGQSPVELRQFFSSLHDHNEHRPVKTVEDYRQELRQLMRGDFALMDFYELLLAAYQHGLGVDRVILASVNALSVKETLVGRLGVGDIGQEQVKRLECPLEAGSQCPMSIAMVMGRDMLIPAQKTGAFCSGLQELVQGRTVYLLPVCVHGKAVSMVYLDRSVEQPLLEAEAIRTARQLRDLAALAITKIRTRP